MWREPQPLPAGGDIAVVVGRGAEAVEAAVGPFAAKAESFVQAERLGTGHAVLAARDAIARGYDDLLVVFADTPLVKPASLIAAREKLAGGAAVVVIGFRTPNPTGYGRLIEKAGELVAIREERDCSAEERKIDFCNGGLMAVDGRIALELLDAVGNANAKGEYYLTDIVEIARAKGRKVVATEVAFEEVLGINNRVELAEAEAIWQKHKRREMMLAGVSMIQPEAVVFAYDTVIGQDTVLEPGVFFAPGVTIAANARIRPIRISKAQASGRTPKSVRSRGCDPAPSSPRRPRWAISARSRRPRSARAPRSTT
jgi:bifunctional UDP-N-acetylglucosamine pyrophosphorylase/glucosamine-1-phosphate N-acetyltransferase